MVRAARVLLVLGFLAGTAQSTGPLQDARALAGAGKHQDALALLASAASRFATAGDRLSEAEAELLRSSSLRAMADRPAALKSAERALALAEALHHPSLQARAITQIARLESDAGRETEAAVRLQRAWQLAEASRDPKLAILVGEARAANARARGNGDEAVRYFDDVIAAADRSGDKEYAIRARSGRSSALLGLGRFDDALADGERAYALAASAPVRLRANATFALAQVHAHLWNLDRAAQLWEQSIALYRETGLQIGVALSLRQSMDTWLAMGEFDRAFNDGSAALAMYERTGSQGALPDTLARLALVQARRGDTASAGEYARRARAASTDVPARRLVFIENDLGLVELFAGRPGAAVPLFERVAALAREQGDAEYEWRAVYGLGRAALALGRPAEAQAHLQAAAAAVERLRRALPAPAQRATFMTQRFMVHEALIHALMARSTAPDDWFARRAFDVAETSRARALADQLAEAGGRSADPVLRRVMEQEAESSRRLSSIQKSLHETTDPSRRQALTAQLAEAEFAYDSIVTRARRDNPRLSSMAWPEPIGVAATRGMLAPGETLIEFAVGEAASWAWAIRADQMLSYRIPAGPAIDDLVRRVRKAAIDGDAGSLQTSGHEASQALFGPAGELLRGTRRLIVIPHGSLQRMPFSALPDLEGGWMIERRTMSVAPSATVLASLRAQPAGATGRLLALAAPRGGGASARAGAPVAGAAAALPNAAAEAREASRLAGGDSAVRVPARESDVRDAAGGAYRVLHFAAHALVDERVPRRSAILLDAGGSDDGLLQLNEIPHLNLDTQLVVLAACRSQMGRAIQGEGLLSLSRAFLQAGARAVVATLWDVRDKDSRRLTQLFYRHLRRGAPADEALRQAQLELLRASGSPARWSAFVVSGDARPEVLAPLPEVWRPRDAIAAAGVCGLLVLSAGLIWIGRRDRVRPPIPAER